MVVALALAVALGAQMRGPNPALDQLTVGPIHLGERIEDVRKALGPGWRGSVYDKGAEAYFTALVYTDGVDQLELYVVPTTDQGEVVDTIVARENRAEGGAFRRHVSLRTWRWDLGFLFEAPVAAHGWSGGRLKTPRTGDHAIASYDYGHPLSVWFIKNEWGGVDFHMFSE